MRSGTALIKRLYATNPWVGDVALTVSVALVALLLAEERRPPHANPWRAADLTGQLLIVATCLPLLFRRRAPVVAWACAGTLWVVEIHATYWPLLGALGPLFCLFWVATSRSMPLVVGCTLGSVGAWTYSAVLDEANAFSALVGKTVVTLVMCGLGLTFRELSRRNERLAMLTEELRREQEERSRRAVAQERVRIARELHDVVAHHMSVISIQAGLAGYVFSSDPGTARGALDTIASTSQEALEEMRRLLSVLRMEQRDEGQEGAAPYDAVPGIGRITELVERVGAAGLPVELRVTGEPRVLAPGVELCAYRVVQEALTNVIKHAGPAHADVHLRYQPHQLVVLVTDDGALPAVTGGVERTPPGSGHGLMGMRERARLYGGTVTVGPRPEGGFGVRLILPTAVRVD